MRTFHLSTTALSFIFAASVCNTSMAAPVRNIVLVHGFFADGSGWKGVADILVRDGFHVTVVQEPETSFGDDVQATTRALDAQDGDSILVGHSYGGAVITEAGNHPKAAGLVYVSAFQPDVGESLKSLIQQKPPAGNSIKATADGYLYIEAARFRADFAADLPAADTTFMALSQVMPAARLADTPVTQAAWKTKPSWAVVSTEDRTVNPDLQRYMAQRAGSKITEIKGSHAAFVAHPAQVAQVIEQAAAATAR